MGKKFAAYDNHGAIYGFYDSMDSPVPAGVNALAITDAQWQMCVATPGYTVQNGALVAPNPATQTLAAAQAAQIATLSAACASAIVSGWPSSALGASYTYPSKMTDQQNMSSSVIDAALALSAPVWLPNEVYAAGAIVLAGGVPMKAISGGTSAAAAPAWPTQKGVSANDNGVQWQQWTTPFWCEDQSGKWLWIDHSATEIVKAGRDVKAAILLCQTRNATLQAQVLAATSVADVLAINWPAS